MRCFSFREAVWRLLGGFSHTLKNHYKTTTYNRNHYTTSYNRQQHFTAKSFENKYKTSYNTGLYNKKS
jgi:hypothetical protein